MNIIDAIKDPNLFRPWFKDIDTWVAWLAFLKVLFAIQLNDSEVDIFQRCTGRTKPNNKPISEAWLIVGRRGGKSFITALIAVFLACFRDYSEHLSPGERGTVMIIASDRKQSRVIMRYIIALLEGIPMLAKMIEKKTSDSVDLTNSITIEIHTSNFKSVRGYTVVAAICDEIAFWRSEESASPDVEILAAIRPAMATIPNALLICLSTPYARRGALYEAHRDHFGHDDDPVLIWQADTLTMNPTVPKSVIDAAYKRDPASASAEYGAEFRSDVEGFLNDTWIDSAIVEGRHELPPIKAVEYHAFCDPSGGGQDSFTLGIAHKENGKYILDLCRGKKPPFNPSEIVSEYSDILKRYGISRVTGDRYSAMWVIEAFAKHEIIYEHSLKTKSEIYLETEPLFATGHVELLDNQKLVTELRQLERRPSRTGKDSVDHPPRSHDDLANSACGVLLLCKTNQYADFSFEEDAVFTDTQDSEQSFIERNDGGEVLGGGASFYGDDMPSDFDEMDY